MKIVVYGAMTGGGHRSVLEALAEIFETSGHLVESDEDFYETVCESNRIMSDFYNLIQQRSMRLLEILSEVFRLEGPQQRARQYPIFRQYLDEHLPKDVDAIISVTPLINYPIIRYLSESGAHTKFFIVVTDPYRTMYPGFEAKGATAYFCPSDISKNQLVQKGISPSKIVLTGYPIRQRFFDKRSQIEIRQSMSIHERWVICINCGVGGNIEYLPMIIETIQAVSNSYRFLVICGENRVLYYLLKERLASYKNVTIYGYVTNMEVLLRASDICLTKAGANTVYESLASGTFPLIVGFNGLAYQEKGVYEFLEKEYGVSQRITNTRDIIGFINKELNECLLDDFKNKLFATPVENGALRIVDSVLAEIEGD